MKWDQPRVSTPKVSLTQSIDTQNDELPKVSTPRMTNYPKYRKFLNFITKHWEVILMPEQTSIR